MATRRSPGADSDTIPIGIPTVVRYINSAVLKKKRNSVSAVSGASDP
jgi:hypothetical protein